MIYSNWQYKMLTSRDLVGLLMEREKIPSMYATAKRLEISESTVQGWCKGRRTMTDDAGVQIALLLGLPTEWIILSLAAERAISKLSYPELANTANRFTPAEYQEKSQ